MVNEGSEPMEHEGLSPRKAIRAALLLRRGSRTVVATRQHDEGKTVTIYSVRSKSGKGFRQLIADLMRYRHTRLEANRK